MVLSEEREEIGARVAVFRGRDVEKSRQDRYLKQIHARTQFETFTDKARLHQNRQDFESRLCHTRSEIVRWLITMPSFVTEDPFSSCGLTFQKKSTES